jgi:hypothetical protein
MVVEHRIKNVQKEINKKGVVMARNRKVTQEILSSMRMLRDNGVKASMIAEALGFSKWVVYQGMNADWDFNKYKQRTAAIHKTQTLNNIVSAPNEEHHTEEFMSEHLEKQNALIQKLIDVVLPLSNRLLGVSEHLRMNGGMVKDTNRILSRIASAFEHIDKELTSSDSKEQDYQKSA